jgi:hypothetical protein
MTLAADLALLQRGAAGVTFQNMLDKNHQDIPI